MFGLGAQELIIIGVIILLLFGGRKLPELMRGLGSGVREFRTAMKDPQAPEAAVKPTEAANSVTTSPNGKNGAA